MRRDELEQVGHPGSVGGLGRVPFAARAVASMPADNRTGVGTLRRCHRPGLGGALTGLAVMTYMAVVYRADVAVVWLNGAFGVGKTTVAAELARVLPGARRVDPERIGFVMRRTFWRGVDYQDVALWRRMTSVNVSRVGRKATAIVPMTVTDIGVFDELTSGAQVFLLTADRATLEHRIAGSLEGREWRSSQVDRCLGAFEGTQFGTPVSTVGRSPAEIAGEIADAVRQGAAC